MFTSYYCYRNKGQTLKSSSFTNEFDAHLVSVSRPHQPFYLTVEENLCFLMSASSTSSTDAVQRRKRALADAVAGVAASLVSLWAFYPIEVWKTNLQAGSSSFGKKSMLQGCWIKTLHTASSSFCYFFLYTWIFEYWKRRSPKTKPHPITQLVLSAIAAMINTIITLPLDVISSQQITQSEKKETQGEKVASSQMDQIWQSLDDPNDENELGENEKTGDSKYEKKDGDSPPGQPSTLALALEVSDVGQEDRWSSLWKGLTPSLLLCSNPSIHYTVFDVAKNQILTRSRNGASQLSMPEAFIVGVVAKFVATVVTYPLIRAKVILMVTSEESLLGSLIRSYKREGVRGMYKGCDWQLLHTVLKSALMMMVREKITISTHQLLYGQTTTQQER